VKPPRVNPNLQATISAIRELERFALSASDPLIANYARAFFEDKYARVAVTMVEDIQRHSAFAVRQLPKLGTEPFNLSSAELDRAWDGGGQ
jgi:hypothetical protein